MNENVSAENMDENVEEPESQDAPAGTEPSPANSEDEGVPADQDDSEN